METMLAELSASINPSISGLALFLREHLDECDNFQGYMLFYNRKEQQRETVFGYDCEVIDYTDEINEQEEWTRDTGRAIREDFESVYGSDSAIESLQRPLRKISSSDRFVRCACGEYHAVNKDIYNMSFYGGSFLDFMARLNFVYTNVDISPLDFSSAEVRADADERREVVTEALTDVELERRKTHNFINMFENLGAEACEVGLDKRRLVEAFKQVIDEKYKQNEKDMEVEQFIADEEEKINTYKSENIATYLLVGDDSL
jgi:hypothetical protein